SFARRDLAPFTVRYLNFRVEICFPFANKRRVMRRNEKNKRLSERREKKWFPEEKREAIANLPFALRFASPPVYELRTCRLGGRITQGALSFQVFSRQSMVCSFNLLRRIRMNRVLPACLVGMGLLLPAMGYADPATVVETLADEAA